jgi:hypothetical protein
VSKSKTPQLPVEIFGVIAEHLIGQHAFGSTANLNRISRAVHQETLPVLYESFFVGEYGETATGKEREGHLPENVKYTK